jgi:hypothetical protein
MADHPPSNGVDHHEGGYEAHHINLNSNVSAK